MSLNETGQDAAGVDATATGPAAAQTNAATTDAQTGSAEGGEDGQAAKTFTQADVDDIVKKAKAKAEDRAERRVMRTLEKLQPRAAPAPAQQQQEEQRPARRQGEAEDAYLDRLTDWKLDVREGKRQNERLQEQNKATMAKTDDIYAKAGKLPGFDRESFDDLAERVFTRPMVEALVDSDVAPQLMHYMASHPEEVERIAGLSAVRQVAELGKLEAKAATTPLAKTSKAPDTVDPTGRGRTPVRDLASSGMDDYVALRKKQGAAWAR